MKKIKKANKQNNKKPFLSLKTAKKQDIMMNLEPENKHKQMSCQHSNFHFKNKKCLIVL